VGLSVFTGFHLLFINESKQIHCQFCFSCSALPGEPEAGPWPSATGGKPAVLCGPGQTGPCMSPLQTVSVCNRQVRWDRTQKPN
jgi:hypothetical protein